MSFDYKFDFLKPTRKNILEELKAHFPEDSYETTLITNSRREIVGLGINYKQQESISKNNTIDHTYYDLLLFGVKDRSMSGYTDTGYEDELFDVVFKYLNAQRIAFRFDGDAID